MNTKYYFILNPKAGQGKARALEKKIADLKEKTNKNIEVYFTKEELDAQVISKSIAENNRDNNIRIYACGGDGTVNEVINGIVGFDNVEIGIIPTGTGNDFLRNFATKKEFLDLENQIYGNSHRVDIIRYNLYNNDYMIERYGLNMFNIGLDSKIAQKAGTLKKLPAISGHMAYTMGTAVSIFDHKMINVNISSNGKVIYNGEILLVALGNGAFCGGGIKALTKAEVTDGLMDISIIRSCKRRHVIKMFSKYKKGSHLDTKIGRELFIYDKVDNLIVEGVGEKLLVSVDGELEWCDKVEFQIIPKALNIIVPR